MPNRETSGPTPEAQPRLTIENALAFQADCQELFRQVEEARSAVPVDVQTQARKLLERFFTFAEQGLDNFRVEREHPGRDAALIENPVRHGLERLTRALVEIHISDETFSNETSNYLFETYERYRQEGPEIAYQAAEILHRTGLRFQEGEQRFVQSLRERLQDPELTELTAACYRLLALKDSGSYLGLLLEELDRAGSSPNVVKNVARVLSQEYGWINVVLFLRDKINDPEDPDNKTALKEALRFMLPIEEGSDERIFTDLRAVYEQLYARSQESGPSALVREHEDLATQRDLKILKPQIKALGQEGKPAKTLDVGCGMGRNIQAIREAGISAQVIGIDYLDQHVAEAKKRNPDNLIIQGTWDRLPFSNHEFDLLYSFGRSLPHNETPNQYQALLKEANRVLEIGGRFVFDLPSLEHGTYQETVERVKKVLTEKGIMEFEEGTIYDGPAEGLMYTRWILDNERLIQELEAAGFKLVEMVDRPIEGTEDVDRYFIFEKVANLKSVDAYRRSQLRPRYAHPGSFLGLDQELLAMQNPERYGYLLDRTPEMKDPERYGIYLDEDY